MATYTSSALTLSTESVELSGAYVGNSIMNALYPSSNPQLKSTLHGPVAILWDIENCPVPSDVRPEDVAGNIRTALRVHPIIQGNVTTFSAYGDFNAFTRRLREGCQRTGVKLIDVPNGRKDAADKAILVDMFLFALDNPPPSSIMLISGDVDFSPALHILGQRGYAVILVIPSGVGVSSALTNAGNFVWDWPSIAHGIGYSVPSKTQFYSCGGSNEISGCLRSCHISEPQDGEESIVYQGASQNHYNPRNLAIVSQSTSGYPVNSTSRSSILPSTSKGDSSYSQNEAITWGQPIDFNGLKAQIVKLLEMSGGCMPLNRIMSDYQRCYARRLYVCYYGVSKLVNLLKLMSDTMIVEEKGKIRLVYLRNVKLGPGAPDVVILKRDNKGKGIEEEQCLDINTAGNSGGGSSSSLSDDENVLGREENNRMAKGKCCTVSPETDNLKQFKDELQDILVSYGYECRISLPSFEGIYQQRYQKPLDYEQFGVDELEDLFHKVRDVVELQEEPIRKIKFISAVYRYTE